MTYNSDFVISLVEPVSALAEVVDLSDPSWLDIKNR